METLVHFKEYSAGSDDNIERNGSGAELLLVPPLSFAMFDYRVFMFEFLDSTNFSFLKNLYLISIITLYKNEFELLMRYSVFQSCPNCSLLILLLVVHKTNRSKRRRSGKRFHVE